jgi:hypothetical protein
MLRFLSRGGRIVAHHEEGGPHHLLVFPDEDTAIAYLCKSGDDPEDYETHPLDDAIIRVAKASGCTFVGYVADASKCKVFRSPLERSVVKAFNDEVNAKIHRSNAGASAAPSQSPKAGHSAATCPNEASRPSVSCTRPALTDATLD